MSETLPLYAPGHTISKDRFGNLVDIAASLTERFCLLGDAWRIDTGYVDLLDTAYASISFTTPETGRLFYTFSTVDKSGAEVVVSMLRAPTITGGDAAIGYNYFDDIEDSTCPATNIKTGVGISGGTERFVSLVPGDANPSSKPGGASRQQGIIILRKNTTYAVKFLAKGGAVSLAANIGFAYISAYP